MPHDPNKFLMGTTGSNVKEVSNHIGAYAAGIAVRLKSDNTLSITKADGDWLGVSLGKDLSDSNKNAICRKGLRVPIALKAGFDPTIGGVVSTDDATGLAAGDGTRTASAAVFATGRIGGTTVNGGVTEDGSTVGVALIDMPGGL